VQVYLEASHFARPSDWQGKNLGFAGTESP
jgi:hypothetical protein